MGKHLTYHDRLTIERMLLKGFPIKEIADAIGCHVSTIYKEIKRARYKHTVKPHLPDEDRYNPDGAQMIADRLKSKKRYQPKILQSKEYRHEIRRYILKEHYSPEAALFAVNHNGIDYGVRITSPATIYTAIRKGYLKGVTMIDCPLRGKHKQKKQKVDRTYKRKPSGTSIEKRDESVLLRDTFGHWEADTVAGSKGKSQYLLVLTERKTRFEIIEPLPNREAKEVAKAFRLIQAKYGSSTGIFKTITCDNGTEFYCVDQMEKLAPVFFAHPRSPFERGTNENNNKLIRRFYKKGKKIDTTRREVKSVEKWMNNYPRRQFGGESAQDRFNLELALLNKP